MIRDAFSCASAHPRARSDTVLGITAQAPLPQSLAPAVAPLFLLIGGGGNYPAVFIAGAVFAAIGALVILGIRSTR